MGRRVGDRRRLAAHHVGERVGVVAVLLRTVVLDRLVKHGDRHLAGRDLQCALNFLDIVVAGLRAARQCIGERVGRVAGIKLATRHIVRSTLTVCKAVATYRHRAAGQRSAVIGLAVVCRGQRHVTSVNAQLTVNGRREGVVGGHIRGTAHHLVASHHIGDSIHVRHSAFHRGGQHITIQQYARCVGKAVVGQRHTVVLLILGVCRDSDRGRNLRDGLVAVRHREGHIREVCTIVGELTLRQSHIGGIDIRPCSRGCAAECDTRLRIETVVAGEVVTRRGVRLTVIDMCAGMTSDSHCHAAKRVDGEHARCQGNGVVVGHIGCPVHNLIGAGERAGVRTGIGTCGDIADGPSMTADEVVSSNACNRLCRAVVSALVRLTRQGHRTLFNGNRAHVGRDVGVERLILHCITISVVNTRSIVNHSGRIGDPQRV